MNVPFRILQWADEVIHPKVLINSNATQNELIKLETGFLNELKKYLELVFTGTKLSRRRTIVHLRQLVNISNTIYGYLFRLSPVWKQKSSSLQLRATYLNLLIALEKIIDTVRQMEPQAYSKIPLTLYHTSSFKMGIKGSFSRFLNFLNQLPIEIELSNLLEREFKLVLNKKQITQSEIDYVIHLIKRIENTSITNTVGLIDMLYLHGVNAQSFFCYYSNAFNNRLKEISNLHDQLQAIISEQDRFNGLCSSKNMMFPNLAPIDVQFKNFLSQKERNLKEIIGLRRLIIQDEEFPKTNNRQKIFLSVAQLSLFIRLLIEKGLLAKENIGEQFSFFATHFSTPQTPFISAESLRKKSTDVEFSTAQKLKSHLIGMLNWLNENYNLSNYKNS